MGDRKKYNIPDVNRLNNHYGKFIDAFWVIIDTHCAICRRSSLCGSKVPTLGELIMKVLVKRLAY